MSLPDLVGMDVVTGADFVECWKKYCEVIYQIYLRTVAHGRLQFRGLRVSCQFRPETLGKHYAFWHMMQEGHGPIEDNRTIDLERCKRVRWISWVIQNAEKDQRIRVFPQQRGREKSVVFWLHEENYAVILWERNGYWLLKTAFMVTKTNKQQEFERDWKAFKAENG